MTYSFYVNDTWRINNRLTLTPGLRFDRFVNSLPEQSHPAGRFSPTPITFAAVDDLVSWNLFGPRFGVTYDLTGTGRTVLKFNYGQYWWNPEQRHRHRRQSEPLAVVPALLVGRHQRQRLLRRGRTGQPPGDARAASRARVVDPDLEDTYTRELSGWFERELAANFGVRTGFVVRQIRNQRANFDANRPFSAFNVPGDLRRSRADGRSGTADDGPPINGFNLEESRRGLPTLTTVANQPDANGDYYTWEVSGNRRMSGRWSLRASFTHTWNYDHGNSYAGNTVRQYALPYTPNDLINTDREDGAYEFTNWTAKLMSTIEAAVRHQADADAAASVRRTDRPHRPGRVQLRHAAGARRAAQIEPVRPHDDLGSARGEGVPLRRPLGAPGSWTCTTSRNGNAEFRQIYVSGASFGFPSTIIPPRIVRFGVKVDW